MASHQRRKAQGDEGAEGASPDGGRADSDDQNEQIR
jgi:hypothetical protein